MSIRTWSGVKNCLLFICSRIKTSPYYASIYNNFINNFADLPYTIVGRQLISLNDFRVKENLPDNEYYEYFKQSRVLFYHSSEKRHLHYHPLEAIAIGMPVIYMADGLLDHLAGEKLPNSCETFQEAREKISKVLNGDKKFINLLRNSQNKILIPLSPQEIMKVWQNNFLPLVKENVDLPVQKSNITLGIFIPLTDIGPFYSEGIMRLLGFIIPSWQEQGNINLRIACASWVEPEIKKYLSQLGAATAQISFITPGRGTNFTISLIKFVKNKIGKRSRGRRKNIRFKKFLRNILKIFRKISSEILYRWWLTLLLLPILLVTGLIIGFSLLFFYSFRFCFGLVDKGVKKFQLHYIRLNRKWELKNLIIKKFHRLLKIPFNLFSTAEIDHLHSLIIKDNEVDCWYFPFPRGKYMEKLVKPIVVALPDIVHLEFPTRFNAINDKYYKLIEDIVRALKRANATISYSNYIRDTQVVKTGYHNAETAYVIPHAPINLKTLLNTSDTSTSLDLLSDSREIICDYIQSLESKISSRKYNYLANMQFGEMKYLFVSSQSRPHKNFLNLIKAFEKILREEYFNVKLIITGSFEKEISDFIESQRLHLDVLSFHNLPAKVHAAFYCCADLSIAPTLFEGGFPFVFSESLSVGTPVVLSDIPVVREYLKEASYNKFIFDPYSVQDIVNKTKWALTNRGELLALEQKILTQMNERTWNDVASEYYKVFKSTIT